MMWYEEEFDGILFGDRRRNRRFLRVVASWWARLGPSIAGICQGWAEQMAAYRLFACTRVTLEAVLAPHRRLTLERVRKEPVVLLVQDTTELDYEGKPIAHQAGEVGPLNTDRRVGMQAHLQYAVTPDRRPLGVLGMFLWARSGLLDKARTRVYRQQALSEKESYRWYRGYRTACALQRLAPATRVVSVADREGDIYEVLVAGQAGSARAGLLIRCCQDRAVALGRGQRPQSLRLLLHLSPALGAATLAVPAGPGRAARAAQVTLQAQTVTFRPPYRTTGKLPPVTMQAVLVREVGPPPGEAPIEWMLITSLPIATLADVQRVIEYYACRWEIEVFFRLWKSGCQVESFQWQTRARLAPCLGLCAVLAWRIHWVGRLGQADPDAPCTVAFTEQEWVVIALPATGARPAAPPPISTVLAWVAKLGGFAGRRSDGPPGPSVLMRGWLRVQEAFRLYGIVMEQICV
jgi:hypothetical protein